MPKRATIVIDIGKTMSKASLWTADGALIERCTRPNAVGAASLDTAGIEAWLSETLKSFAGQADVGHIIPVAHGAAAAVIADGRLLYPPRDYETAIPPAIRAEYDRLRAPFAETGSPSLPDGLNLGAQLYAQKDQIKGQILLWPQYWAWLLSGVAASEVTSFGTHTDLWNPAEAKLSRFVEIMGWTGLFPPLRHAGESLGPLTAAWAMRTGLRADTQIYCGIHDSNAALIAARGFPEIADKEATVLSTGTWFIGMRTPKEAVDRASLSEARDCLINVDAFGTLIPSARWMGGREIEGLIGIDTRRIDIKPDQAALIAAIPDVISSGAMLLPCFAPGFGPYPDQDGVWINQPALWINRRAAVSLYAALVTDASLTLIGANDCILIEGRFAEAEVFIRALASLRPDDKIFVAHAHNDVSFGALRLLNPEFRPQSTVRRVVPLGTDIADYRAQWQNHIDRRGKTA